jgi:hypothetical protein
MKVMPFFVAAGLLLLVPIDFARAGTIFPGETFAVTGIATQTLGAGCCGSVTFSGIFVLGSMVPSTSDWTLTAFDVDAAGPGLPWSFSSLEFDALNNTLFGTASAPRIGGGGHSKLLTLTFIDGNTSTNLYNDADLTDPTNSKAGTFSYTASPVLVPEPSSGLLLLSGLGLAAGLAAAWRNNSILRR